MAVMVLLSGARSGPAFRAGQTALSLVDRLPDGWRPRRPPGYRRGSHGNPLHLNWIDQRRLP